MTLPRIAASAVALALSATSVAALDIAEIGDAEFGAFLQSFEAGTERFMNGDPALWKSRVSHRDDTMIMGAWGGAETGWPEVSARYDWAAARFVASGARLDVEYLTAFVSGDLAYTTAIERASVRLIDVPGAQPMALRVTHVFRKEDGNWRLVLRHADPLVAKTAVASVIEQ